MGREPGRVIADGRRSNVGVTYCRLPPTLASFLYRFRIHQATAGEVEVGVGDSLSLVRKESILFKNRTDGASSFLRSVLFGPFGKKKKKTWWSARIFLGEE